MVICVAISRIKIEVFGKLARLTNVHAKFFDLPFIGCTFTWSNNHETGVVAKKLDRILVNDQWQLSFPNFVGVFGKPGISDHSPCCVFLDSLKPKPKRPFKFYTLLNQHPEFSELIKMLCVSKKLKELKSIIRHFSRENYLEIEKRVKESYADLLQCQQDLLTSPSDVGGCNLLALKRQCSFRCI
ncbi:unnamed protein product [Thlaspi arvense]|uniref:Endonuclease/exonuclease/phosphatase domain-containing protein n=1 Tax=Thlaspi arvense TaxID=13288 RepID=A0AAU9SHD3_THLAR|nr:unnamed protein product [Thlaspi arvense]